MLYTISVCTCSISYLKLPLPLITSSHHLHKFHTKLSLVIYTLHSIWFCISVTCKWWKQRVDAAPLRPLCQVGNAVSSIAHFWKKAQWTSRPTVHFAIHSVSLHSCKHNTLPQVMAPFTHLVVVLWEGRSIMDQEGGVALIASVIALVVISARVFFVASYDWPMEDSSSHLRWKLMTRCTAPLSHVLFCWNKCGHPKQYIYSP